MADENYLKLFQVAMNAKDTRVLMILKGMHESDHPIEQGQFDRVFELMNQKDDIRGLLSSLEVAVSIGFSDISPFVDIMVPKLIAAVEADNKQDINNETKRVILRSSKINHEIFDKESSHLPVERLFLSLCLVLSSPTLSPLLCSPEMIHICRAILKKSPDLLRILWNKSDLVQLSPVIVKEPQVIETFAKASVRCQKNGWKNSIESFVENATRLLSEEETDKWCAWLRQQLVREGEEVPEILNERLEKKAEQKLSSEA